MESTDNSRPGLSVEDLSCKDVWLKISLNDIPLPIFVSIKRNDEVFTRFQLTRKDTIIRDGGLPSGQAYTYQYCLSNVFIPSELKNILDLSNTVSVRTLDTTSHNFSWSVDSIGGTQSQLNGIWGSSSNDVWAVGLFYDNKPGIPKSVIAHYDGSSWTRTYPSLFNDPVGGLQGGYLDGIYGTSKDKMWVVGTGLDSNPFTHKDTVWAYAAFWNKTKWENISPKLTGVERLFGVWAYDEMNVWAIGPQGTIIYYDGKSWVQQNSGTNYTLFDIHGTSPDNLYVIGFSEDFSRGILLKYDGTNWHTVQVSVYASYGAFQSVWAESEKSIWIGGVGMMIHGNGSNEWDLVWSHNSVRRIRGDARNDVFFGGYNGTMGHFNGKTVMVNKDMFAVQKNFYVSDILVLKDKVFYAGQGGEGFDRKGMIFTAVR